MSTPISVPTMKGVGNSFKDFGIGLLGGIVFLLATRMFGGLGVLAAPLLAGSMLKGEKGTIIATIAGFMLIAAGGIGASSSSSSDAGVM